MALVATFEVSEKEQVDLNEYNGSYELISKYNNYQQWAKYRIGKDAYSEKDRPVKVPLGDEQTAIRTLLGMLEQLTGTAYVPVGGDKSMADMVAETFKDAPDGQDVPF